MKKDTTLKTYIIIPNYIVTEELKELATNTIKTMPTYDVIIERGHSEINDLHIIAIKP